MPEFRIYADGNIVFEDEFEEVDHTTPYYDDYSLYEVPEGFEDAHCWDIPKELYEHIKENYLT